MKPVPVHSTRFERALRVALFAMALVATAATARAQDDGVVTTADGGATVIRAGVGDIPPATGVTMLPGDTYVTETDGRAILLYDDGLRVTIGTATQLTDRRGAISGTPDRRFELVSGTIRVLADGKASDRPVVVETASAVVRFRGSYGVVTHDAATGTTTVVGFSGETDVSSRSTDRVVYTVGPGQWSRLEPNRPPAIPAPAPDAALATMIQATAVPESLSANARPGFPGNLGDDPLRDWPKGSAFPGQDVGQGNLAQMPDFEAFSAPSSDHAEQSGSVELDRESDVTVILIFNDANEKRVLKKK